MEYKKLTPFKIQCLTNFPFIDEDFDALSNYGLLCKIVEYINKMADNNNILIDNIDSLNKWFNNLDVQDEINNKLDQMAESGQLEEIIGQYVNLSSILVFDNVNSMKQADNLINGSVVKTLGFYEINDGGNALYKIKNITNNDVVDEKFIIALNNNQLIAELIYDNINVKQIGAYGDDIHDDTLIINDGIIKALNENKILYFPKATYKVSTLNLKSIIVKCDGYINNSDNIIVGAVSTGGTLTVVDMYRCNDVQIEGAKGSQINILHARNITLYADGNDNSNTSIAYNKITGLSCNHITLNGVNNGWINENVINYKRCLTGILITGDTYSHNNNHFENICIEGSSAIIQIDNGHNNYITYRGEDYPQIILSNDFSKVFDNVIEKQVASNVANTILPNEFDSIKTFNFIGNEFLPNYRVERLFELNKYNVKNLNSALYLDNNNKIVGSWQYEFASQKLDASFPFMIYVKSSHPSQRLYITCYDESDNKVEGNVLGGGINYDSTNKQYKNSSNASAGLFTFIPSDNVKYIELIVGVGSNVSFDYMTIDMYLPFTNTQLFANTIKTDKKYLNQIPSNITTNNPTWEVGDIVYNSQPSTNLGWVCTTAGTGSNSVWKEIPIN